MLEEQIKKIKLLAMDVDGTLTDGSIYIDVNGEAMKRFDVKDGLGISLLNRAGITAAIITGRKSKIVLERARELKITEIVQDASRKDQALKELAERKGILMDQIAYIGDDLNDLPALLLAGLAVCPADAAEDVKKECHIVLKHNGGFGAVREIAETILRCQGRYETLIKDLYGLKQ